LQLFHSIYTPLENQLAEVFQRCAPAFDLEKRRKSALVVTDLGMLGVNDENLHRLSQVPCLPLVTTLPRAYGCLYVLEGATLGGQIISRHVKNALGLDASNGAAFFNSYGNEIGRMWREFGDAVTAYAALHGDEDQIIAGARETFAAFVVWFSEGDKMHE